MALIPLVLFQTLYCGYSLESSWQDDSNEYPQHRLLKTICIQFFVFSILKLRYSFLSGALTCMLCVNGGNADTLCFCLFSHYLLPMHTISD